MKIYFVGLLLLCELMTPCYGQQFLWGFTAGDTINTPDLLPWCKGLNAGLGIAIDNDGSCYVSGLFDSSITIGGNNFRSNGGIDGFLARLSGNGHLQWFKNIGGKDLDFGTNVATDSAGFVYTSALKISNRSVASLSRYTRSGDLLWTITDTFARSQIRRLVVDKAGDAYILILMDSCVTLGNTVIIDTSGRRNSMLIAKIDTHANCNWWKILGPLTTTSNKYALNVALNNDGNVIVAAHFDGKVVVDTVSYQHPTLGSIRREVSYDCTGDIVVIKYTPDGKPLFSAKIAQTEDAYLSQILPLSDGGVVLSGTFSGSIDLGTVAFDTNPAGTVVTHVTLKADSSSAYVIRTDSLFKPIWGKVIGCSGIILVDGLSQTTDGTLCLLTSFSGSQSLISPAFGSLGIAAAVEVPKYVIATDTLTAAVTLLDQKGNFRNAFIITPNSFWPAAIACRENYIYTTGSICRNGGLDSKVKPTVDSIDLFVAKYSIPTSSIRTPVKGAQVKPNRVKGGQLYDLRGRRVYKSALRSFATADRTTGVYVRESASGKTEVQLNVR